jgi:hypothetical protein
MEPVEDEGAHKVADVIQFGEFAADFEIENRRRCPHNELLSSPDTLSVQEGCR